MPCTVFPTGTTLYNPEKAYNCYVHYEGRDGRSFLVDMNGNTVQTWNYTGFPSEMIDPAINNGRRGDIVCQKEPEIYANETLLIVDWDSNILWEWGEKAPGGKARQNHDLAPLANGNLLIVNFFKNRVPGVEGEVDDQGIYEVNRAGDIVWSWISSEHIEELGFTGEKKELLFSKQGRPRSSIFVINDMQPLGPNKWYEQGDERFHPDNIMIDRMFQRSVSVDRNRAGGK